MKIKINKLAFRTEVDWGKKSPIVAEGDVAILDWETTFKGVPLAWNTSRKRFIAYPPALSRGGNGAMWSVTGELAKAIAAALVDAYRAMGGEEPEVKPAKPKRQFIPLSDLELSEDEGLPLRERIEDALEDESRKRGVECYTEFYERTEPEAEGHEETEGLHRVLGIDPVVAAECDRAGL
jgi:hypothetical protein